MEKQDFELIKEESKLSTNKEEKDLVEITEDQRSVPENLKKPRKKTHMVEESTSSDDEFEKIPSTSSEDLKNPEKRPRLVVKITIEKINDDVSKAAPAENPDMVEKETRPSLLARPDKNQASFVPLTKWQTIKRAIYNPESKKILGRTIGDWGRLGAFYTIFYGILATIFGISMSVLLQTMEEGAPKWKLGESLIGTNPGLGFRPMQLEYGALIWYDTRNSETSGRWVNLLDEFLAPYQKNNSGQNIQKCVFGKKPKPGSVCQVNTEFGPCGPAYKYGYNSSSPCVFIKVNKIFGWIPTFYTEPKTGMPEDLVQGMKELPKEQIWLSCTGEDSVDKNNVEGFKYYPGRGFPGYYYPYKNVENYLSPLIAVHIVNPTPNVIVNVECRAWAANIEYKKGKEDRQGSVHFAILVDRQ